jgi:hypothetical protein
MKADVNSAASAWWSAMVALVVLFVASRVALVATSYAEVTNWEEPVYLYSALELQAHGLGTIFDHQDDLSHGGSLPLILLAAPWVHVFGPRLDVLKGVPITWATATLVALMFIGRRYVSAAAGVLIGLLYAGLSANAAQLNVTLVGSHPESVLFCTLALAAYWHGLEDGTAAQGGRASLRPASAVLLGLFSGLAIWCSYLAAPFVIPLLAFHAATRTRQLPFVVGGLVLGLLPWGIQNLWLRPHGAAQWRDRLAYFHATRGHAWDGLEILERVGRSFGFGEPLGAFVLVVLVALALTAVTLSWPRGRSLDGLSAVARKRDAVPALQARGVVPLALGALASIVVLAIAQPHAVPAEGYYYYRFFIPLQLALCWLAALAIVQLPQPTRTRAYAAACATLVGVWILGQVPLYGRGYSYEPDLVRDRGSGCAVFGHAELDRAGDYEAARTRLERIEDEGCRLAAFTGYGWALVSRYSRNGYAQDLSDALADVGQPQLRSQACAAARQLMATMYPEAMPEDRRRTGTQSLDRTCG